MVRLLTIVSLCILCGPAASVGIVPDSLDNAHDIVETRLWLRAESQRLFAYRDHNWRADDTRRDPANVEMGDWPSGKSYSDTLAIAEEARQKEPVDWRTLAPALEALNALTPEDSRLEDLCTAILTSPLPEQIDRHNFTAVMKSLAILAKQKTPQGVALLYDWIDFHRWTDSSSTLSFVTVRGDQQEMAQKTARQMRSAGLDAISRYVELDLAFQILEESRDRSEEEDPSITKRIDDCLITLNQRLEGDASRFNSGDGH